MVAIPMMLVPYFTPAAGPTSHSPPPIAVARRIAPGPITRLTFDGVKGGGVGRSATPHGGRPPVRGCAAALARTAGMGAALYPSRHA